MTDEELGFWTTAAGSTIVLALALILEYQAIYGRRALDSGWRSYKMSASLQILGGAVSISIAFFNCLIALSSGESTSVRINSVSWALATAFAIVVLSPALALIVQVWIQPADPNNPEPQSRRKRRKAAKVVEAPATDSESPSLGAGVPLVGD
jgi:hypothetical protein